MAAPITLSLRPRLGRGLNTRIAGLDSQELADAFLIYENVIMQEGAWMDRRREIPYTLPPHVGGPVRSAHAYNRDVAGEIVTDLIQVIADTLYTGLYTPLIALNAPYDIYYSSVKNRVFLGGRNNDPMIWDNSVLAPWGAWGPSSILTYTSLVANNAVAGVQVQTVGVTNGSPAVTRVSGANFQADPAWVGKTIMIDGVEYPIQTVTGISALTLAVNYDGATASPVAAQVHYGSRTWTGAPKYAYAYYNPTTGHCTNGSPVLTLAEMAMTNVDVEIHGIVTNATLFDAGYTKILMFRNPQAGGGTLLNLKVNVLYGDGLGMFNNSGGPLNFVDEAGDEDLGVLIGYKEMPTENDPCPQHSNSAYWQNRFWVIDEAEPWKIRYSADPSLSLGVPEESFPPLNFIECSTEKGYAHALRVVGSSLLVATQEYAYFVTGTSPSSFDLARLSTRGFGISQRGIAEHPGDSSVEQSSAIYVSRDKRVWRHYEGGRIEDIGAPIQEFLDQARLSDAPSPFLVRVCMAERYWVMALGISSPLVPFGSPPEYEMFFYDFDTQQWMDWGYRSVHGTENRVTAMTSYVQMNLGSSTGDGKPRLLLYRNAPAPIANVMMIQNGIGGNMKFRFMDHGKWEVTKKLSCVRLFTDADDPVWYVNVTKDGEMTADEMQLTRTSLAASPRIKGPGILEFVPKVPYHYRAISPLIHIPPGRRLHRIDIDFTPESSLESGSPN